MYLFLNQYSFVVISILILSIIGFLTWRFLDPKLSLVSIVVMLSLLGSFYFTARGSVNQVENISDQVGKDFRKEYNLDLVPSFLVFDKYGNESFRKKLRIPEAFEVLELIE